jgi:hypothetical protein
LNRRPYREPTKIRDLLPGVLRGLKPRHRSLLKSVRAVWPEIVGGKVAARSRVASLSDGVLRIELESAALKQHLATFKNVEILEEIKKRFPRAAFSGIRYAIGRLS